MKKILIIEDEEVIREELAFFLKSEAAENKEKYAILKKIDTDNGMINSY